MASSGTTSTRKRFTGAEFIVHFLEQQGIKIVTGIPGGSILPVYDALSQSTQIRHILARHEQGAGFIAQGMARTDGKPAVCMACSGPGATNLVTAIADARLDSIPLICITGQVPASMIGTDAFQEVDTYGISIPITKHNYLVRHIEELPQVMSDAFRIAQSGRPGSVWIDIPKDVQTAVFEIEAQPAVAEKAAAPAFSEESILCLPIQDSDKSHIWLLVNDDQRLEQMISQIDKLEDVVKVQRNQSDPTMFNKIAVFFQ